MFFCRSSKSRYSSVTSRAVICLETMRPSPSSTPFTKASKRSLGIRMLKVYDKRFQASWYCSLELISAGTNKRTHLTIRSAVADNFNIQGRFGKPGERQPNRIEDPFGLIAKYTTTYKS